MPYNRAFDPFLRHRSRRWTLALISVAALVLAGCGGSDDDTTVAARTYAQRCQLSQAPANSLELPAPTGQHCIGKTGFHLVDPGRAEANTVDTTDRRELHVKVWYPATVGGGGGTRAPYLDPAIQPLVRAGLTIPNDAPEVFTNARQDAPAQAGRKHPVVIFSPGYGMVAEGYSTLLEDLASHGLVVVAIDHPYVSGATPLTSGEVVPAIFPPDPTQLDAFEEVAATMVADQRQVLDWLQDENIGPLAGHLDLTRIGVYGHSIGGAAALQTLRQDARATAAIDIDGMVLGGISSPWSKPLMFLLAESHPDHRPGIDGVLRAATGPHHSATVQGAGHLDFGDLKLLLDFYVPDHQSPVWTSLDLGPIEASSALTTTRQQTLAFFRQHIVP